MENKVSFILYADQRNVIQMLPDDKAGQLIKHIFAYVNDENPHTDDPLIQIAFEPIKQQFKRDLAKWKTTKEGRSAAGKASAEARRLAKLNQQTSTNPTNVDFVQQTSTNSTVNDNVNVNVNDNVNVNVNKKDNKGVPPPFVDFIFHCREKAKQMNLVIDEDLIRTKFDAWLEGGWKDMNGKNILNWKAKISSNITYWQKKEQKKADTNFLRVYT